jgi:hypothetical protein
MVKLGWIAVAIWFVFSGAPVDAQTSAPPPAGPAPAPAPALPRDRGRFAAIWVAPIATHQFQGAGVDGGYRYHWLAGVYRVGFLQNGYAPPHDVTPVLTLERTRRIFLELEVDGQWRFHDQVTLAVGGGVALLDDRVEIASTNGATWTTATDLRGRIRPLIDVTLVGPIFQSSFGAYVGTNPEVRLSLGICLGRHARP